MGTVVLNSTVDVNQSDGNRKIMFMDEAKFFFYNDMLFVARGAWFSAVCNGREKRRASRSSANDEHLCLIAVIRVERPLISRALERERDWRENWTQRKKTGGSELSFLNCFVPSRLPRWMCVVHDFCLFCFILIKYESQSRRPLSSSFLTLEPHRTFISLKWINRKKSKV